MPLRVAYIARAPFLSGAERSLQVLLRHARDSGIEPIVIGPPGSVLAGWCASAEIDFRSAPLAIRDKWHPIRWGRSVRALRSIFRRERVELIHSNQLWSYQAAGAAARTLGLPRVCHVRDDASPEALRWFCAPGVEALVCISAHVERQVSAAWTHDESSPTVRTLLNPVEFPERLNPAREAARRAEARNALGVDRGAFVLGFIGQVVPVKGLADLIDALSTLAGDARWMLLVAGRDPRHGAPHEGECRAMVEAHSLRDRVRFLGFLEDAGPFYDSVDLVVVPSREEPLGRVPLEAAAYGRPSLAAAVGGLPETIEDGETGWLYPAGDVDALARALASRIGRPMEDAGSAARERAGRLCEPVRYAGRLRQIYDHLTTAAGALA